MAQVVIGQVPHDIAVRPRLRFTPERVFRGAMAVLVLHIVVGAFIALEPGVRWSDHLIPAFVPIALVALAVALFPRVARSGQAALALPLAVWTLTGAGLAIYEVQSSGVRASDLLGLLLLPVGIALAVMGVWLLWASRKRDGHVYLRRALLAFAALLFIWFVVYPISFAIVVANKPRAPVVQADWGRPSEEVTLHTSDGLVLAASYVPSENGAAVILVPRQFAPVAQAQMLARHGFGVLVVDMRGQGASEGDSNAYGWDSTNDLDAAVAFLRAREDVTDGRIGGLGLSVGGEQMIEAAASNSGLQAIAVEGVGFHSAREGSARQGPHPIQLAIQSVQDWVLTGAIAVLSGDMPPPSLVQSSARVAPRPMLFMLGENDNGNERLLTPAYYESAGEPKTLWEIPGAGHTMGIQTQPEAYEQHVVVFFDAALLKEE